ncbi:hypothetical protein K0A96_01550 [Patescibacteria group bacterium]|nr:hypothetical protein [Patescibacteria group bacterium]
MDPAKALRKLRLVSILVIIFTIGLVLVYPFVLTFTEKEVTEVNQIVIDETLLDVVSGLEDNTVDISRKEIEDADIQL